MKKLLFFICTAPLLLLSQGGWIKVTNTLNPIVTFTSAGTYKGASWVDINNDGNIDLFAMPHFMFINNGGGNFTQLSGLNINTVPTQTPGGSSWADIDNDGDIDFITAQNPTEIYLNNGSNTFQNITSQLPELSGYASWGCSLADVNNDNKLDILYAHANGFHAPATPQPCKLFIQNSSSFGFTQKTGYYFTDSLRPYTVPYFHDYDLDGDMDLFIASGPGGSAGPDYCYKNMKKETGLDTLYKMTVEPWSTQLQDGQCYNFIDYDNDNDLDMCLTNYAGAPDRFYKNNGSNTYSAITTAFTNGTPNLSNSWGDFDNDGDLDVIIASDYTTSKYYKNNNNGTFTLLSQTFAAGVANSCIVSCDYDNDGDLDIFVHGTDNAKALYKNDTVAANRKWVNYTLKGTVSNISAIGAVVKIKATINGVPVWQIRTVTAQNSFQGQNDLRQHFGLNNASLIDSVFIAWPSGIKEVYINKPVNQFQTLFEGNGTVLSLKENKENSLLKVYPNPSKGTITILIFNEKHIDQSTRVKIFEMNGTEIYNELLLKNNQQINLNNKKPGTYLVSVIIQNKPTFTKVIITE